MPSGSPASFLFPGTGRRAAHTPRLQLPLLFDMLQASPQKIDLQRLSPHLALQRCRPLLLGPALPRPREGSAAELPQFPPPAAQHIRIHFTCSCHLGDGNPHFHPPHRRFLELLRELPARQSHGPILLSLKIVPYLVVSKLGSTPVQTTRTVGPRKYSRPKWRQG